MPTTFTTPWNLSIIDPVDPIDPKTINDSMQLINDALDHGAMINPVNSALFIGAYPPGISLFPLTSATVAADTGWNIGSTAVSAEVVTFKPATDRATQFWFRNGSLSEGFYRHGSTTAWTPWRQFGDGDFIAINNTADLTVPDATWVKCSLTTVEVQNSYCLTSGGGGINVRMNGIYTVECTSTFVGSAGTVAVNLGFGQTGDAGPSGFFRVNDNPGSSSSTINGSWTKSMNVNDTIFMFLNQTSGANKTSQNRRMTVRRVGWY